MPLATVTMALAVSCSTVTSVYKATAAEIGDGSAISFFRTNKLLNRVSLTLDKGDENCPDYGSLAELEFDLEEILESKTKVSRTTSEDDSSN
jgi:hypothetical protein